MSLRTECHARAVGLLADLQSAASTLPRREVLSAWLHDFISRTGVSGATVAATEQDDLAALEKHLRGKAAR